jgi:hypothetical protein
MLHACFTTIALCFVYTSRHFYAFSGTNQLTRCHSASSFFLLFLCFRKVTQEIFSELDETKAKLPIYLTRRRSHGEGPGGGHTIGWSGLPPGHAWPWCGPLGHPLTSLFRLQIPFIAKTLSLETFFHETYSKPPPSSTQNWEGPEALPGTLPERGIITGDNLHHHASLQSDA